MALIPNGGSRKFQSVMPPKRRFEIGQYGAKFKAESKPPPKIILKRPTPGIESRGKLGGGRSMTGWYIPEGGDIPALKHVSEEFRENLTPESRTALMNVPTKVGKSASWYAALPLRFLSGLAAGSSMKESAELPPGAYIPTTGNININPDTMRSGEDLDTLMQHELLHAWDADRMDEMRSRGETLTGLPGILDRPREAYVGGPGAEGLSGDLPDWLKQTMESRYGRKLKPPENYAMLAQIMGFDPSKIPAEYQHLYTGLFNQESFVRPPPPEPLKIDDILEAQKQGISVEEYLELKKNIPPPPPTSSVGGGGSLASTYGGLQASVERMDREQVYLDAARERYPALTDKFWNLLSGYEFQTGGEGSWIDYRGTMQLGDHVRQEFEGEEMINSDVVVHEIGHAISRNVNNEEWAAALEESANQPLPPNASYATVKRYTDMLTAQQGWSGGYGAGGEDFPWVLQLAQGELRQIPPPLRKFYEDYAEWGSGFLPGQRRSPQADPLPQSLIDQAADEFEKFGHITNATLGRAIDIAGGKGWAEDALAAYLYKKVTGQTRDY